MEAIQTEEYKGYKIEVYPDECVDSPRDWDNFGHMICFHSEYNLGDEHNVSVEELKEIIAKKDIISLPLYLYDHSGITMSTGRSYPFNCPWDSGQVGYIYVTREEVLKEYSRKKLSRKLVDRAIKQLNAEVEVYDQYIMGEVYCYIVENEEGDVLESCGGFLGDPDDYMIPEAKRVIDHLRTVPNYQI